MPLAPTAGALYAQTAGETNLFFPPPRAAAGRAAALERGCAGVYS